MNREEIIADAANSAREVLQKAFENLRPEEFSDQVKAFIVEAGLAYIWLQQTVFHCAAVVHESSQELPPNAIAEEL
jgi:hypothetical protein